MKNKMIIVDYVPFTISNRAISESLKKNNGKLIVSGKLQTAGEKNQNNRIYSRPILERELQKYSQLIKERRALGELDHPDCFSDAVRVLTAYNGWKLIKDVSIGEEVLSLGKNDIIEIKKVTRVIYEDYVGDMIRINNRNIKTLITPTHKFIIRNKYKTQEKIITAVELYNNSELYSKWYIPKRGNWEGIELDNFTIDGLSKENILEYNKNAKKKYRFNDDEIKKYQTDLVLNIKHYIALVGLYLSEGTSNPIRKLKISQSRNNSLSFNLILDLFKSFPPNIMWDYDDKYGKFNIDDIRIAKHFGNIEFGNNVYNKKIPSFIKQFSKEILAELFYWFAIGDGRKQIKENKLIPRNVFSVSEQLIDDLQEILFKSGGSGNRTVQVCTHDYKFIDHIIKAINKKPLHVLNYSTTDTISLDKRFLHITKEYYSGKITCLEVEDNSSFYVSDQGKTFWTHNSSVVNLQNVSHLILDAKWNGNDIIGTIEILNTPAGNILKNLIEANVLLGISSRGLGSVNEIDDEGTVEVGDDFDLIAWDFVSNPSTMGAFMKPVKLQEGVNRQVDPKVVCRGKIDCLIMNILIDLGN